MRMHAKTNNRAQRAEAYRARRTEMDDRYLTEQPRSTQPGHPSVDRRSEYTSVDGYGKKR